MKSTVPEDSDAFGQNISMDKECILSLLWIQFANVKAASSTDIRLKEGT